MPEMLVGMFHAGSNFAHDDLEAALLHLVPYLCGTEEEREPIMVTIEEASS